MKPQGRPIQERHRRVMGQPPIGTRKSRSLPRWPLILVGLALVGAFGFLGFNAFRSASMYYVTPSELLAKGEDAFNDDVRLNGTVMAGTVGTDADSVLHFTVTDDDGAMIPVVYGGVVPDTFQEGTDVVVEGGLTPGGVFEATTLLAKCPSKYESGSGG